MASKSTKQSDLMKAQGSRGVDTGRVIANEVIDRIVSNSSQEFQDYLKRAGGGNASANAAAMVPAQSMPSMPMEAPPLMPQYQPPMSQMSSPLPQMPLLNPYGGGGADPGMVAALRAFGLI
ncbi:hypothetical protein [Methylobacillus sp.]|uniref:hypothetical protein n=1 Tax=Methylobacillus sp. TaxID=56818 RepID=UPI002FE03A34